MLHKACMPLVERFMNFKGRVWQKHQTPKSRRRIKKYFVMTGFPQDVFYLIISSDSHQNLPNIPLKKPYKSAKREANEMSVLSLPVGNTQLSFKLLPTHDVHLKCDRFPRQQGHVTKSPQELRKAQLKKSMTRDDMSSHRTKYLTVMELLNPGFDWAGHAEHISRSLNWQSIFVISVSGSRFSVLFCLRCRCEMPLLFTYELESTREHLYMHTSFKYTNR